jgi:hypothetical protein
MKRTREDEHICMETSQGNSLYSHINCKLDKKSCFSFYLFYSTKSENRRPEPFLPGRWGAVGTNRRWVGGGERG